VITEYPGAGHEQDAWILARRGARNPQDPRKPYAFFIEQERSDSGEVVPVAALFLTNRECPWRCLMCDLWKNTLTETVPVGAIPEQIDFALTRLAVSMQSEQRLALTPALSPWRGGSIRPVPRRLKRH